MGAFANSALTNAAAIAGAAIVLALNAFLIAQTLGVPIPGSGARLDVQHAPFADRRSRRRLRRFAPRRIPVINLLHSASCRRPPPGRRCASRIDHGSSRRHSTREYRSMTPQEAAFDLAAAFCLSAVIGFERQWRNRLAGLRTNTLVALGAATFVVFAQLFPEEASPTRVAAQVVSGIGFLGAGLIFREGAACAGSIPPPRCGARPRSAFSPVPASRSMRRSPPASWCSSTCCCGRS